MMIASCTVNGVSERTRPIYLYPLLARYVWGMAIPGRRRAFVPFDPTRR